MRARTATGPGFRRLYFWPLTCALSAKTPAYEAELGSQRGSAVRLFPLMKLAIAERHISDAEIGNLAFGAMRVCRGAIRICFASLIEKVALSPPPWRYSCSGVRVDANAEHLAAIAAARAGLDVLVSKLHVLHLDGVEIERRAAAGRLLICCRSLAESHCPFPRRRFEQAWHRHRHSVRVESRNCDDRTFEHKSCYFRRPEKS